MPAPSPPSFADVLADVEERRRTITIYAPALPDSLVDLFETRHVTVEHRFLPEGASEPFLTVTAGDRYVGSVDLPAVYDFTHPQIHDVGSPELVEAAYRKLTSLLPDTVFSALDRRQLLAAAREIEDRAWRVGTGRLDVGFQTLSKFRAQADVYDALATRDLDIYVYVVADRPDRRPAIDGVTVHTGGGDLSEFWFMAFDGGPTSGQACGLVAEETSEGYSGFWTYDPELVERIFSAAARFPADRESELP